MPVIDVQISPAGVAFASVTISIINRAEINIVPQDITVLPSLQVGRNVIRTGWHDLHGVISDPHGPLRHHRSAVRAIPPSLSARVLPHRGAEAGVVEAARPVDLGTGPGLLALGFAPYVGRIVGVDPEPAMLEAARKLHAE
jgi:SAM-dependent methyltransferase